MSLIKIRYQIGVLPYKHWVCMGFRSYRTVQCWCWSYVDQVGVASSPSHFGSQQVCTGGCNRYMDQFITIRCLFEHSVFAAIKIFGCIYHDPSLPSVPHWSPEFLQFIILYVNIHIVEVVVWMYEIWERRLWLLVGNGMPRVWASTRRLLAAARQTLPRRSLNAAAALHSDVRDGAVPRARRARLPPLPERPSAGRELLRRLDSPVVHILHRVQRDQLDLVLDAQHLLLVRRRHQVRSVRVRRSVHFSSVEVGVLIGCSSARPIQRSRSLLCDRSFCRLLRIRLERRSMQEVKSKEGLGRKEINSAITMISLIISYEVTSEITVVCRSSPNQWSAKATSQVIFLRSRISLCRSSLSPTLALPQVFIIPWAAAWAMYYALAYFVPTSPLLVPVANVGFWVQELVLIGCALHFFVYILRVRAFRDAFFCGLTSRDRISSMTTSQWGHFDAAAQHIALSN